VRSHAIDDATSVTISYFVSCDIFDGEDVDFVEQILEKTEVAAVCLDLLQTEGLTESKMLASLKNLMKDGEIDLSAVKGRLLESMESTHASLNFVDVGSNVFSGEVRIVEHISVLEARKFSERLMNKFSVRVKTPTCFIQASPTAR